MRVSTPSMRRMLNRAERGELAVKENSSAATYGGILVKTLVYVAITVVAAIAAVFVLLYSIETENDAILTSSLIALAIAAVPLIILSIVATVAPHTVVVIGPIFCVFQGALLGVLAFVVELLVPGLAIAAVVGTAIVFIVGVVFNKLLSRKIVSKLARGAIIAVISLVLIEVVMAIVSIITQTSRFVDIYLWIQLGVSVFSVIYGTFLVMFDLQYAESLIETGADKTYEWAVAYSLISTLVYLYVEILELLLRLATLFSRKR